MRALICLLALVAVPALAIEQKDIKVSEKWAVVGVIAGSDPKGHDVGIAVLRNNQTKHTYTLAIGDAVPNEFGFILKAVQNRNVVIANGERQVTLGFAEAVVAGSGSEEERENRTARFIDNYYRGLSDSPIEIFKADRERDDGGVETETVSREGLKLPLRRFGSYKEDSVRSRFDVYRNDGGYAEAGSGEPDGDGFLVNYSDNFQDDGQQTPADGYSEPSAFDADTVKDPGPIDGARDFTD